MYIPSKWPLKPKPTHSALGLPVVNAVSIFVAWPLNFKSAFSLQRIFRCQIFLCKDWQFGVLVLAVLFAWEMAWHSPIVNIVLQTIKRQLFMNTLVIDGNSKSLSVKCCLETKMRRDVKLHCGHHRIQVKMRAASLQLVRTHTQFPHCAKRAHDKITNSLCLALHEEQFYFIIAYK